LNAGDSFQGTLWYNIGRWNVTSQLLNILPADAMTLGNHEFDHGVEGVVPFLDTLETEMLVANMDARDEPTLQGKYKNSTIIERSGRKIGLIGVILESTNDLANTGKLIFRNESDAIRDEAAVLRAQGVNIIIVISHCGYDVDKLIAQHAGADIDVIVGAHSHTFLYTGENLPGPEKPWGDYPTKVIHKSGHQVLIVQASAYARYVGNLTVYFDDNGDIVDFDGAPIYMNKDVPQDPETLVALEPWKQIIDEVGNVYIGETKVDLIKGPCSSNECNLGSYFCDAMIYAFTDLTPYNQAAWTNVSIGLVNTGSLRVSLSRGNLTYSRLVSMSPFENVLTAFDLKGEKLREALEFSVSKIDLASNIGSSAIYLQVAGLRVTYNYKNAPGERIVDLKVRCADCEIPKFEDFDDSKTYRIVAPSFLANGGDGFTQFRDYATQLQEEMTDLEALITYTKAVNPIYTGIERRISVLKT